jgi:proton glutamate symport protein
VQQILLHMVPTSVIEAMATGDVLQIVVFSIVFAIGLGMVGEKGKPFIAWAESLTEAMFKVTNIVMLYAPIGVGAAIAVTIGTSGLEVLANLAKLVGTLYLALAIFFAFVLVPVMLMFRIPILGFFKAIKEPALIAFSTTSSEAALPRAMESVERSACRAASSRSSCRSATASTSMAARCTCHWRRCSSRRPRASN